MAGKSFTPYPGMMVDVRKGAGAKEGIITEVKPDGKNKFIIKVKVQGSPHVENF